MNLDGHSSVNGLINGNTANENNVLALNFTGLTPAAIAALKARILAQGNPQNFVGSFTVRGIVYNVNDIGDPAQRQLLPAPGPHAERAGGGRGAGQSS